MSWNGNEQHMTEWKLSYLDSSRQIQRAIRKNGHTVQERRYGMHKAVNVNAMDLKRRMPVKQLWKMYHFSQIHCLYVVGFLGIRPTCMWQSRQNSDGFEFWFRDGCMMTGMRITTFPLVKKQSHTQRKTVLRKASPALKLRTLRLVLSCSMRKVLPRISTMMASQTVASLHHVELQCSGQTMSEGSEHMTNGLIAYSVQSHNPNSQGIWPRRTQMRRKSLSGS